MNDTSWETIDKTIEEHAASYGRFPLWWAIALRTAGAGVMARDVLAVIASYADKLTGEAWPSIRTMARTLYVGEHAVKTAIRQLVDAGILKTFRRNRRAGETNLYRLVRNESERFQVTDTVTKRQTGHVTKLATKKPRLGDQSGPLQVTDLVQNQVHGSCSSRANNLPVEPTKEPSLLRTGRDEEINEDGYARFREVGKRLRWTA